MNPDLLNTNSYWSKVYTYTEMEVQLVESIIENTNQSIVRPVILNRARLNDELRFLMALESVGRAIRSEECINHRNKKHRLASKVVYTIEFKKLIQEAVQQSLKFISRDATSIERFSRKRFSPYVQAVIAEIDAFGQILPSFFTHEVIDDVLLDEVVKKVEARFKKRYQKQIRQLEYDVHEQLSSYFDYTCYLTDKYGSLKWVKVSLHPDLLETFEGNEKLNVIGALSRDFCKKLKRDKQIFNECVGYICSLNTLLNESVHADVILFFSVKESNFDLKKTQFSAVNFWHSHFTGLQTADVIFKCSLKVYLDSDSINIKKRTGILELPGVFEETMVNLVVRHQLIGPKDKGSNRIKLVSRGEMPRSFRRKINHA
jgi:hypothetical protein